MRSATILVLLSLAFSSAFAAPPVTGAAGKRAATAEDNSAVYPAQTAAVQQGARDFSYLFVENNGQIYDTDGNPRPDVRYTAGDKNVKLFFTDQGLSYVYVKYQPKASRDDASRSGSDLSRQSLDYDLITYRMDMQLIGMNRKARLEADDMTSTPIRYYSGNTAASESRSFRRLRYVNVYDNIDLVFYTRDGKMKYDFVVKPGGNIADIKVRYAGSERTMQTAPGGVRVLNPLGELNEEAPVSFLKNSVDPTDTESKTAATRFIVNDGVLSFEVDGYERGQTVVIDPGLLWSTFYGGSNTDRAEGVAVDGIGNVYVSGSTASVNFPTVNGIQFVNGGQQDAFVMKINSNGATVAWATFYGGSDQEFGRSIVLDGTGNVISTGYTTSGNFPVTPGAYQTTKGTVSDAYLLKLNSNGQRIWATFYGGNDVDFGTDIAVDNSNNIIIAGQTQSTNLTGTFGMFQQNNNGTIDAYIAKFTSAGSMSWATYIGGTASDVATGVDADGTGNIYVGGSTHSANFPVSGGFQGTLNGINDAFIIKFNSSGTRLWATYYGGSASDLGTALTVSGTGDVFITGETSSVDLSVPPNVYRPFLTGGSDAFIARFSAAGSLTWGTYIGGSGTDAPTDVTAAGGNAVAITGITSSTNYPVTPNAVQTTLSGPTDAFVSKIGIKNPQQGTYQGGKADSLFYSSFFGGTSDDAGMALDMEGSGNLVMGGISSSALIPLGANTIQIANGGTFDAIVAKFCDIDPYITPAGNIILCAGDSVELDAGPNFTSYYWYPAGQTTRKITVKTSGNYVCEVTDINGCFGISRDTVKVTISNPPVVVMSSNTSFNTICIGTPAAVFATVSGGRPPYVYSWTPTTSLSNPNIWNPSITPTVSTTYYVAVTDSVGCVTVDSIRITVNPLPVADAGPDKSICFNAGTTIGTPAVAGNNYAWVPATGLSSASAAQPTANPPRTTTYVLTVTTPAGCVRRDTVTVVVNPDVHITPAGPVSICVGGSIELDAGDGYVSYLWSTTANTRRITVSAPGTYYVTVQDNNGCTANDTVVVNQYTPPTANAGTDVIQCREVNVTIGGVPAATGGAGNYSYSWSPTTGLSNPNIANPVARPQSTTTYTLTVTDANGCTDTDDISITITPTPTADAGPDVTNCKGLGVQIGRPATGGSGVYTYSWSPALGLSDPAAAQPVATPVATVPYIVTVSDNVTGCIDKDTVIVNAPLRVVANNDVITCSDIGAALGATVTGGTRPFTYQWTPAHLVSRPTSLNTSTFTTDTTTFVITVTDASGCIERDSMTVYVNPAPIAVTGPSRSICIGESITIGDSALSGTPPFQYLWTPSDGIWATSPHPEVAPAQTTTYTVTVTDSRGCSDTKSVTVIVNPLPKVSISANGPRTFCEGESVVLSATPGFSRYFWSNGEETQSITVRYSGSYYVTVTDANGCQANSLSLGVTAIPLPKPKITPLDPISFCSGHTARLRAPNGYSQYVWSTGQTSQEIVVYQPGIYFVKVLATNGCWGTSDIVTITVFPSPEPKIIAEGPTVFCDGGSVVLDAGVFQSYKWSTGATTRKITVDKSGTYTVAVKNLEGCEVTSDPIVVEELSKLTPRITPAGPITKCEGEEVILDAGDGYGTYQWSNGAMTRTITVTQPGTFSCVVSSNGCTGTTQSVTVNFVPNPLPVITANGPLVFCFGSSVTLDAGEGYSSYLWSTGAKTRRITVTESGFYSVTVKNANGCVATSQEVEVITYENPKPVIYASGPLEICYGKSVTLTTSEGFVAYLWSNGDTTNSIIVTQPGTYYVRVVDQNGCVGESQVVRVTVLQAFSVTINPSGPTEFCAGGSVELDAGPGMAQYEWSNGATTRKITVAAPDKYWVRVTNSAGCVAISDVVTVTVYAIPDPPPISRTGNTLYTIQGLAHQWYFDGSIIPNATKSSYKATQTGSYTVMVTDFNGCSSTSAPYEFTPVGVERLETAPFSMQIYPDPNNGVFTFEADFTVAVTVQMRIANSAGQTVLSFGDEEAFGNYRKVVNLESLPSGAYFLHVDAGGQRWIRKVVRQ